MFNFSHLVGLNDPTSIECAYRGFSNIIAQGKVIARNEFITSQSIKINKFGVFESHDALMDYIASISMAERTFHEVIIGSAPQKIKLDIDMSPQLMYKYSKLGSMAGPKSGFNSEIFNNIRDLVLSRLATGHIIFDDIAANVVATIIRASISCAMLIFGEELNISDFAICTSSDSTKWSFHIIITSYYIPNHLYAKLFMNNLRDYINPVLHEAIDWGVNAKIQNFRLIGCHKHAPSGRAPRTKVLIGGGSDIDTLITYLDSCVGPFDIKGIEPDINKVAERERQVHSTADISEEDEEIEESIQKILEECRDACPEYDAFEYLGYVNGDNGAIFINFKRVDDHNCSICNRTHTNDARTMSWAAFPNGMVRQLCAHNPDKRLGITLRVPNKIKVASVVESDKEHKFTEYMERSEANFTMVVNEFAPNRTPIPDIREQINEPLSDGSYIFGHTLVVDSGMSTGKTQKLRRTMGAFKRIIYMSHRISFTSSILKEFKEFNFHSYLEEGFKAYDRIIIQYESLHKIRDIIDTFDLLILDEFEQIISCSDNRSAQMQTNSFHSNFETLSAAMRRIRKCIILDATYGMRSEGMLQDKRPGHNTIINSYPSHAGKEMRIYEAERDFVNAIMADVIAGLNVVIATTSKDKGYEIERYLRAAAELEGEDVKILYINGDNSTSPAIKEVLSDVNAHFIHYNVLIYTSTISAGVSFTQIHFSKLYQYCSTMSADVPTAVQMIGRVRDIDEYAVFFKRGGRQVAELTRKECLDYIRDPKIRARAMAKNAKIEDATDDNYVYDKNRMIVEIIADGCGGLTATRDSAGPLILDEDGDSQYNYTNEYLEFRIRQWRHRAFSAANYMPYYLYYITKFGFNKLIIPRSAEPVTKAEVNIKEKAAELRKAAYDLKHAPLIELLPAADVPEGAEGEFAVAEEAVKNLEYEIEGCNMGDQRNALERRLINIWRIIYMRYRGGDINRALKKYYIMRQLNEMSECTLNMYVTILEERLQYNKERMIVKAREHDDSAKVSYSYDTYIEDVYEVVSIENETRINKVLLAFEMLEVIGYDLSGPLRADLVTTANKKHKSTIVAKNANLATFINTNIVQLKVLLARTTTQLTAARKDYSAMSRFINGLLDSIGWNMKTIGRSRAGVDNEVEICVIDDAKWNGVAQMYHHSNKY